MSPADAGGGGNPWRFGMEAHIGVDTRGYTGLEPQQDGCEPAVTAALHRSGEWGHAGFPPITTSSLVHFNESMYPAKTDRAIGAP